MKHILSSLLMLCCIAASSMAQNEPDQYVDFQIVAQGHVDTPIYRNPANVPVHGYYVSAINTVFLSFSYDLGVVTVSIENTTTGESSSESVPTNSGIQVIPLTFGSGLYSIALVTPEGDQYSALLLLS